MINIPAAKKIKTGIPGLISFEIPDIYQQQLSVMINNSKTDYYNLKISHPKRPRTTGWKSQNHHINGHIQQICVDTGNSFSAVKERMKELAIGQGYPYETLPDGNIKPMSESAIDTVQAGYLIDTIHQFAAEYDIRLKEEEDD